LLFDFDLSQDGWRADGENQAFFRLRFPDELFEEMMGGTFACGPEPEDAVAATQEAPPADEPDNEDEVSSIAYIGTATAEGGVNLRSSPSADHRAVGKTTSNQVFHVISQDEKTNWYCVEMPDDSEAWISNKKVTFAPNN